MRQVNEWPLEHFVSFVSLLFLPSTQFWSSFVAAVLILGHRNVVQKLKNELIHLILTLLINSK